MLGGSPFNSFRIIKSGKVVSTIFQMKMKSVRKLLFRFHCVSEWSSSWKSNKEKCWKRGLTTTRLISHSLVHNSITSENVKHITPAVFVIYAPHLQGQHINQTSSFEERKVGKDTHTHTPNLTHSGTTKETPQRCWKLEVKESPLPTHLVWTWCRSIRIVTDRLAAPACFYCYHCPLLAIN